MKNNLLRRWRDKVEAETKEKGTTKKRHRDEDDENAEDDEEDDDSDGVETDKVKKEVTLDTERQKKN